MNNDLGKAYALILFNRVRLPINDLPEINDSVATFRIPVYWLRMLYLIALVSLTGLLAPGQRCSVSYLIFEAFKSGHSLWRLCAPTKLRDITAMRWRCDHLRYVRQWWVKQAVDSARLGQPRVVSSSVHWERTLIPRKLVVRSPFRRIAIVYAEASSKRCSNGEIWLFFGCP